MHRTAAVCKSGLLYMWGYGRWRQLGQEDGNSRNVPVRVDINPAIKQMCSLEDLAESAVHTVCLSRARCCVHCVSTVRARESEHVRRIPHGGGDGGRGAPHVGAVLGGRPRVPALPLAVLCCALSGTTLLSVGNAMSCAGVLPICYAMSSIGVLPISYVSSADAAHAVVPCPALQASDLLCRVRG
eukprot:3392773-Rhodomonas_salina.3